MKKTLLLSLFLFFMGAANAQIVNIPDANFKSYLVNYDLGEPIDTNQDGEIQVSEAQAIDFLEIYEHPNNNISSLEGLNAFTNVTYLSLMTSVSSIDLAGMSQLNTLTIYDDDVTTLNLSGVVNLNSLHLTMLPVTTLDLSAMPYLQQINISMLDNLTSLVIGQNSSLQGITMHSESLPALDLSGCANINYLHLALDNSNKNVFINLKNGDTNYAVNSSAIYLSNMDQSSYNAYVCLDEGEIENLHYIDDDYLVNTYCSFTPGGDYNTIAGAITFDADANGCDINDVVQPFIKVNINDGTATGSSFSNSPGGYNFYTQSGTFTLTPQFENDWFTVTPATAEVVFADNNNNTQTQNFCITANGVHPDVEALIIPVGPAQPGFDAHYKIIYKNNGNQTLSGDIVFTYDDAVLDYVSATPAESASSSGTSTWNYAGLLPFEVREISVVLNINGPMETPAVNIDDELLFSASITPLTGDETPQDNTFGFKQVVTGSFDPNDITCLEGDVVAPEKIGEYLHYNINFENTGNAPATFIVVKDIINEEQFDVSTLQLIYASHDVEVRIQDNKVEFFFDDIQLGSLEKGNVVFKIKTLNTLQANDDVTQQAEIFFDYNWPIVTNEATTVFQILGVGDFAVDNSVKIYPNPAVSVVNLWADSKINSVQLYDVQGRLLQAMLTDDVIAKIDISAREEGIYFIKIMTEAGMKVEKIVKK